MSKCDFNKTETCYCANSRAKTKEGKMICKSCFYTYCFGEHVGNSDYFMEIISDWKDIK